MKRTFLGCVFRRAGLVVLVASMVALCRPGVADDAAGTGATGAALESSSEATDSEGAGLAVRDWRYALNPVQYLFRRGVDEGQMPRDFTWEVDNPPSRTDRFFDRVRTGGRMSSDGPLRFRIEALPDKSTYELCYCPLHETNKMCKTDTPVCHELEIAVTERGGLLHLFAPAGTPRRVSHHINDYEPQRAELSVYDGSTKVYSELLVEPSDRGPDCSTYPERDLDRYTCLYQGENRPPPPSPQQALVDGLPDRLVQAKENYELIFAEEFEGTVGSRPSGSCAGGLSNLDRDKWNFPEDWCEDVDAAQVPCQNMKHGHYEMSYTVHCGSGISTDGKFSYKYGYLETRYTVNLDDSHPQNMAFVIGDHRRGKRFAAAKYGVPITNYREISTYLPIEINLFEYFPEKKRELANWFYNYHPYVFYRHTVPRYASNWTRFCSWEEGSTRQLDFLSSGDCREQAELTVTKGLEWTPRGYRLLVKVEGLHDDFVVVRAEGTVLRKRAVANGRDPVEYWQGTTKYTGGGRSRFFDYLEEDDPDSVLMQFAIGHGPLDVSLGAWRGFGNERRPEYDVTTVRMKVDYIRVFQPRDRYSGMEPLYQ